MVLRRFHYDKAFEHYLRCKAIPYVAVDEARRALCLETPSTAATPEGLKLAHPGAGSLPGVHKLKNFDFVVYATRGPNLLVDVKGRKVAQRGGSTASFGSVGWVTEDDVADLRRWRRIFGAGFDAAFVFLFWCDAQPADALFHEVFELSGRWYVVQAVMLSDYEKAMKPRSARWHTVSVPTDDFEKIAQPLASMLGV